MKVLFVADVSMASVVGGAERVLYEQSTRLVKRGHKVSILTRRLSSHTGEHAVIEGVDEFRYSVNTKNPVKFIRSTIRNGSCLFEQLNKRHCYDAIYFQQPFSAFAVCQSPMARHVRKIYTCHSLSFEEYISRNPIPVAIRDRMIHNANILGRKWMEQYVLGHSDRIVVLSRYTQEKLQRTYRIGSENIDVVPGGVDLGRFSPAVDKKAIRVNLGIPKDRIILLTVRNLVDRMGLANLIEAFSALRSSTPEVYLVIGGTGPLEGKLREMAERYSLGHFINFTGFIPEDLLPEYYRMADLFVLPTKELEGFGLVTLEAMASGVPVAGTPIGGTREILEKFDPEFLFDDTSPSAMAALLKRQCRRIVMNPPEWQELSRKCRDFAVKSYDWNINIQAMEALMAS